MIKKFQTVDVFTDQRFGGNPLAVFPDGQGLDADQMQAIAREFNLSETTFVLPPEKAGATARVRIFTPAHELPFAGHPTLGTAFVMAATGAVELGSSPTDVVLEEGVGLVNVSIFGEGGKPSGSELETAMLPQAGKTRPDPAVVASAVGLDLSDLNLDDFDVEVFSCGIPFLIVPVRDCERLARAHLVRDAWEEHLAGTDASSPYLFAPGPDGPGSRLRARMFGPEHGVDEDPATGSAVAALAGVLAPRAPERDACVRWTVEQGIEMGRPSRLELSVEKRAGAIDAVRVGGSVVSVTRGELELD